MGLSFIVNKRELALYNITRIILPLLRVNQLKKQTLKNVTTSFCALLMLCVCPQAMSNSSKNPGWQPARPIMVTVPSNPGGGWDQLGRFMQRAIGQEKLAPVSIEVVNRGGAGGIIALSELVSRYNGDPYKLMVTGFGMTGATIMHNSEFDLADTTPIARLTSEYQAIGVPFNSPYNNLEQLMAAFKKSPESIVWGGGSAGGADHLFVNLLAEKMGVDPSKINYVAFTGGGEATAALMGGQVTIGVSGYSEWGGLVEAKRVKLLGVSSQERVVNPNIATFHEIGIDVVYANWRALVAAPNISEEQKHYLIELITHARNSQTWRQILKRNNWQDSFLVGDEFARFIADDKQQTQRIVERSGLGEGGKGYAAVGPYFFPSIAGVGLLLSGIWIAISAYRRGELMLPRSEWQASFLPLLKITAILVCYLIGLRWIGFIFVTPLLIPALAMQLGSSKHAQNFAVGVVLTLVITLVFENFLNVLVP